MFSLLAIKRAARVHNWSIGFFMASIEAINVNRMEETWRNSESSQASRFNLNHFQGDYEWDLVGGLQEDLNNIHLFLAPIEFAILIKCTYVYLSLENIRMIFLYEANSQKCVIVLLVDSQVSV